MKPRMYFNSATRFWDTTVASPTMGYPLTLPNLDGIEFAVVRPINDTKTWQVIHVRSGLRCMYRRHSEKTQKAAKLSCMAELEHYGKKMGWEKMVRRLKRKRTSCIVDALAQLKAVP